MRFIRWIVLFSLLALAVNLASAHANLIRSEPTANASLSASPDEIRLWFSEPLEAGHSRITLRDSDGAEVAIPSTQVDDTDRHQMFAPLDEALMEGLYTVSWRALSAADGHLTQGSFAFGVGVPVAGDASISAVDERVAPESVFIRWLNFVAMSLTIGGVGFWLFTWRPLAPADGGAYRLTHALAVGWVLLGAATLLGLLSHVATATGTDTLSAAFDPALMDIISETRFGALWLIRAGLWLALGAALLGLLIWRDDRRGGWLALIFGGGYLLAHSLFGHANNAPDTSAAVAAQWLHLTTSTLWVGGLMLFAIALWTLKSLQNDTALVGRMVAYFSNYARVLVAALVLTGLYAGWLHVGSFDALTGTLYGQALIVKIGLFLPVLALAAFNMIVTGRGLNRGGVVWTGRLRGLVGAEIVLLSGVLIASAVLASGSPARGVHDIREAQAAVAAIEPLYVMDDTADLHVHLEITPGTVGENTFRLSLFRLADGQLVTDASLIRLRFDSMAEDLGQSELRPELQPDDTYTITGANLSIPGEWRIRTTIQRPGRFDEIVDLRPVVAPAPPPVVIDSTISPDERLVALILLGLGLAVIGGYFVMRSATFGSRLVAGIAVAVGAVGLLSGAVLLGDDYFSGELTVRDAWMLETPAGFTGGVYLTIDNHTAGAERLIDAETPVAGVVEIHETEISEDRAMMRRLDGLDIPVHGRIVLEPGGYHIMLIDIADDLNAGAQFPLTLIFESGLEYMVDVRVVDDFPDGG